MATVDKFRSWSRQQGAPVTIGLLISLVVAAVGFWLTQGRGTDTFILGAGSHTKPWTFLTYAWTALPISDPINIIFFAFLIVWMFWIGGSLERQMGSVNFAITWFGLVLLSGVIMWAGALLMNSPFVLAGPYLPEAALSMIWCARNPSMQVMMMGLIPMSAKVLAIALALMTLLTYGAMAPLMGAIALVPLAIGWAYGIGKIPQIGVRRSTVAHATRAQTRYGDAYYDDVKKREQERDERERLRKLFEGSLGDED
jgi:hypothetical protein